MVAIRQRAAATEGAIGTERDWPAANGQARARFGRAVDDEFGIDAEPEAARALLRRGHRTGYVLHFATERRGLCQRCGGVFLPPRATNDLGDFRRACLVLPHQLLSNQLG